MARKTAPRDADSVEFDDTLRHLELSDTEKAALQEGLAARARKARPLKLDNYTRRDDSEVLPGGFARIETGDHAGEVGVFESVVSADDDGYPEVVVVRLRRSALDVVVDYADLTPTRFSGF